MKRKVFYSEIAYIFGIVFLALGASMMEKANFGMSMVVAPAYLVYLKLSPVFTFVTFGMAEYCLQAILLIVLILVLRKFKVSYLYSFVTAVVYGFILDLFMNLLSSCPSDSILLRVIFYIFGLLFSSFGVSMMFNTYISPEVYELFVKETSKKYNININNFKTCYDCVSCAVAIIMSFSFFGLFHFEGVRLGTVFCALINGQTIGLFTRIMKKYFVFKDGLNLRKYFE